MKRIIITAVLALLLPTTAVGNNDFYEKKIAEVRMMLTDIGVKHADVEITLRKKRGANASANSIVKRVRLNTGVFRWAQLIGHPRDAVLAIMLHELGHVRLNHVRIKTDPKVVLKQERAADKFAVEKFPASACILEMFLKARILGKISTADRKISQERIRILSSACRKAG